MAEHTYKPGELVMTPGVVCEVDAQGLYEVALACCANERVWIPPTHLFPALQVEAQSSLLRVARAALRVAATCERGWSEETDKLGDALLSLSPEILNRARLSEGE